MSKFFLCFLPCLSLLFFAGCSDVPKGFPKVVPCSVTVTDGGTPIADVDVTLLPASPVSGTVFFGKTDSSGVCKVATTFANYRKVGAPTGSYTVTLVKEAFVEDTKTPEEQSNMSRNELDAYRAEMDKKRAALPKIIPVPLTKKGTSKLTIDVGDSGGELTVDVAQYK